jgi:hypothetical protein
VNTAYALAATALILALALGFLGMAAVSADDRPVREHAPWLLTPAVLLLMAAVAFAGVGLDLQY